MGLTNFAEEVKEKRKRQVMWGPFLFQLLGFCIIVLVGLHRAICPFIIHWTTYLEFSTTYLFSLALLNLPLLTFELREKE